MTSKPRSDVREKTVSMEWLSDLLRLPTAPYREHEVIAWIDRLARIRRWQLSKDEVGNLLIQRGTKRPCWVFVAHMDHPGFVAISQRRRTITAHFRGAVRDEYFTGATARFFTPEGEIRAQVQSVKPDPKSPFRLCRLRSDLDAAVQPGTIGMWDFPAVRRRGQTIFARGCDDIAGVAAALLAFERVGRIQRVPGQVAVLLTRAEEAGFSGAIWASMHTRAIRNAAIISIETSKAHAAAPLGGGAVVRVGDRDSVFDPRLTAHLWAAAKTLSDAPPHRRYVRQLMPGGTCEATVFQAFGLRAGAVCIPLGAYHNMGERGRIAPERIHLDDFEALVDLLVAAVQKPPPASKFIDSDPQQRFERLFESRRRFFSI